MAKTFPADKATQDDLFQQIIAQQQETTFSSVLESIGVNIANVISAIAEPFVQIFTGSSF